MKIAVIQRFLPSASPGGAGHFTHGLANSLQKRGHDVMVYSEDPAPQDALYKVVQIPKGRHRFLNVLLFPFKVSAQDFSAFDLIHAQGDDQFIRCFRRPPWVRTIHASSFSDAIQNGLSFGSLKRFLMYLYFYWWEIVSVFRADAVTAVSREIVAHYPGICKVIPNGLDVSFFSKRNPKSEMPTILFVGDLYNRKRGWLVRKIFQEQIRPAIPNAQLWLACPEKVEEEGVRWLGYVQAPELAQLYPQAWVFCLPSSSEGFGRPYVEAMASGTPVVATPNPGARDIFQEGEFGFVVPDEMLGETLKELLSREDLRNLYRERGLERAKKYDWDNVILEYEAVYQMALKKHPKKNGGKL